MRTLFNYIEENSPKPETLVIIFGLAGDPPHSGHMQAIKYLLTFPNSEIKVVLSAAHAFNKRLSPFEKRKEWLTILLKESFTEKELKRIDISNIEEKISLKNPEKKVHTIDLIDYYKEKYSNEKIALAFGPDNANDETLMRFKSWVELKEYSIIVIPEMKTNEKISRSTQIRYLLIDQKEKELIGFMGEELTTNILEWLKTDAGNNWLIQRKITVQE